MRDTDLIRPLRRFYEMEVEKAPKQHPQRTAECPPLPLFFEALSPTGKGWGAEHREHVSGCTYCQKVTAMQWRITHLSLKTLLSYLWKGKEFPDFQAMQIHLKQDQCSLCNVLVKFKSQLAGQLELAQNLLLFPGLIPRAEMMGPKPGRVRGQGVSDDSLTVATLHEEDDKLWLLVESRDKSLEKKSISATLVTEAVQPKTVELTLGSMDTDGFIRGRLDLGQVQDFRQTKDTEYVLLVSVEN